MITLDPATGYLTLINTFEVDPARPDELVKILSKATAETIGSMPGFVSASLHLRRDKRHVASYAQWRSQTDMDFMLAEPEAQVQAREAAASAKYFGPIVYDVGEAHAAGAAS